MKTTAADSVLLVCVSSAKYDPEAKSLDAVEFGFPSVSLDAGPGAWPIHSFIHFLSILHHTLARMVLVTQGAMVARGRSLSVN